MGEWLTGQLPFHPHRREEIQANILSARQQYALWDALHDSRNLYSELSRRETLQHLEGLLGRERYIQGIMPPLLSEFDVPPEITVEP